MSKNFWECEIKRDDNGATVYNDDCTITIVSLGQVKEYPSRKFQSVSVLGQGGVTVSNFSVSYAKTDLALTQEDLNKPLDCRIKVDEDTSQYALNGRKYTIMLGKKASGSPKFQRKSSEGISDNPQAQKREILTQEQWDAIARGKVKTLLVGAAIQSGQLKITSTADVDFFVEYCMSKEEPKV